ncbi:hypothetical protein [Alkalicoccobacillus porphyridii]|uniref:Uncharacterized protein n=1 Tax=Alkalicoccobacillus porphyridii TaxID=2597270 RepID=A0A553ZVJ6_9BACI|nr:hypothetical protein [Alkalicoccobacillus porphyridii]TSB45501.1 hypothetical protein FN960_16355 [Alkalicoccobacillus porphyridii]
MSTFKRESYYVTLDMALMAISKTKTPDNTIQYQIYATEKEKDQLASLLERVKSEDFEQQQILQRPFDETKADQEKVQTQNDLKDVYQMLYDLGTLETKEIIADIMPT